MCLKPINRFNATKVAIDLSPCLKARGLRLVSGSMGTLICQRGQIIWQTKKRARRDLNPRPTEPESVALSTEPRALTYTFVIIT